MTLCRSTHANVSHVSQSYNMKCFLVVFAFLLLNSEVCAEEWTFELNMVECANEAGLKIDDIETALSNKDNKVGCVVACAMKKIGMMVDGKLVKHALDSLEKDEDNIPNYDKLKENLLKCYDEVEINGNLPECDLAGKYAFCVQSMINHRD